MVPFALALCRARLAKLGLPSNVRATGKRRYVTDNANYILDCEVVAIANPAQLETQILAIPGVVGTGLFLGLAHAVLVQDGDSVQVRCRTATT